MQKSVHKNRCAFGFSQQNKKQHCATAITSGRREEDSFLFSSLFLLLQRQFINFEIRQFTFVYGANEAEAAAAGGSGTAGAGIAVHAITGKTTP